MKLKIAVQMNPLSTIIANHDSTFAMMLEAAKRGHSIWHFLPSDVFYKEGKVYAHSCFIESMDKEANFILGKTEIIALDAFDVILLRQDPPFDMGYITNTHLLDMVKDDVLIVNDPTEVRNAPEKLWTLQFSQFMPQTLISHRRDDIIAFHKEYKDIVVKPLYGMGGQGVFRFKKDDSNIESWLEFFFSSNVEPLMIQRFIPEIKYGDYRIILVNGEPMGALARVPQSGATRANMAAGGKGEHGELSKRHLEICEALGPYLKEKGLIFTGIDVIGDYLTEINVTSPTGAQEIEKLANVDIFGKFWQVVESKIN